MTNLKNANEMFLLARVVNRDEIIINTLAQLQTEIYEEAFDGEYYLITKSLLTLNDERLRVVINILKSLGYDFEFLNSESGSKAHKIIWNNAH